MSLKIEKPGVLTTIQDTGRFGHQKEGIIVSGAMDRVALRIGNLLTGNPEHAAAIEVVGSGLKIRFQHDQLIAITGADLSPEIGGEPAKMWRPIFVKRGYLLAFAAPRSGCYAYVAVAGSFDLPQVMGSHSTYIMAGIGGFQGRALQAGDVIPCNKIEAESFAQMLTPPNVTAAFAPAHWTPDPKLYPVYQEHPTIRVVRGPEYDLLSENSKDYFWSDKYKVTMQSDRMGFQLQGTPLALEVPTELISGAVTFGTIQVPPRGNPIVLMADHQTTGGYPRIAQVITADQPQLAQTGPGKVIRFEEVTLPQAQQHYLQQEQNIEMIKRGINLKLHCP